MRPLSHTAADAALIHVAADAAMACGENAASARNFSARASRTLYESGKSVQDSWLCGAIPRRFFMERTAPETQNPPRRAGSVSGKAGEYRS
jgi:hypothetical protein